MLHSSAFLWEATQSLNHTSFSSMEGKCLWLSWFCLTLSSTSHQRAHPRAVAGAKRWQSRRTCWWFAGPRAAPCPAQTRSRLPGPAHGHKRGSENSAFQHNTQMQQEENKPVFSLSMKTEWTTELSMHKDDFKKWLVITSKRQQANNLEETVYNLNTLPFFLIVQPSWTSLCTGHNYWKWYFKYCGGFFLFSDN